MAKKKYALLAVSTTSNQGFMGHYILISLYSVYLAHLFENTLSHPFVYPNGTKINSLFMQTCNADDLINLSRSKTELQNCLTRFILIAKYALVVNATSVK